MSAPKVACGPLPVVVDLSVSYTASESGEAQCSIVSAPALWPNGSNLVVSFLDGTDAQKYITKDAFAEWGRFANLSFSFVDADQSADVRVTFKNQDAWSAIGIHARKLEGPTLSLGGINAEKPGVADRILALHEVGHVLGLEHEWDAGIVLAKGATDNKGIAQQVKEANGKNVSNFPALDPNSIMNYLLPAGTTSDGNGLALKAELSDSDKAWVSINYPGKGAVEGDVRWNELQALHVYKAPLDVGAQILGSRNTEEQRAYYLDYVAKEWDRGLSLSSGVQETIKSRLGSKARSSQLSRATRGSVAKPEVKAAGEGGGDDDDKLSPDVQDSIAAVLLHPDFHSTIVKLAEADLFSHDVNIKDYPVQNAVSGDLQAQQGILGLVTGLLGSFFAIQAPGAQNSIGNPYVLQGLQAGQPLPPDVQQGIFDVFTKVIKNPIFTNVVTGIVNGMTQK